MKKLSITAYFGIIGAILWNLTLLIRATEINDVSYVKFIFGIMPNIGAAWAIIWFTELLLTQLKKEYNFKVACIVSGSIFVLSCISEVIHDKFLNSAFDPCDMIATFAAVIAYLLVFKLDQGRKKVTLE